MKLHDPVGFPGPTSILRKRLLPRCRLRSDVRPSEPDDDFLPFKHIVCVERPHAVAELPHHSRLDIVWRSAVEPPDRPFVRLWVERPQACRAVGARRHMQHVVVDIRLSIEERLHNTCATERLPVHAVR